jgi:hypothetical protein
MVLATLASLLLGAAAAGPYARAQEAGPAAEAADRLHPYPYTARPGDAVATPPAEADAQSADTDSTRPETNAPAGPDGAEATGSADAIATAPPEAGFAFAPRTGEDASEQPSPADEARSADASSDQASGAAQSAATPSPVVEQLVRWSVDSGDSGGMPVMIIDKHAAEVFVFLPSGQLLGAAPALLGSAVGDDTAPGVGDRELSQIPMDQRTTPAGRFVAHIGPAEGFRSVLWVDFDSATSLHPVITSNRAEHRLERLRSPNPDDRRITHGCINVPAAFYKDVVRKAFEQTKGVVYILPDTKPVEAVFPTFADAGPLPRNHAALDPDLASGR